MILLYLFLLSLIFAKPAMAYIDPGTGSYLFQILVASVLTVLFSVKSVVRSLRHLIRKIFKGKSASVNDR